MEGAGRRPLIREDALPVPLPVVAAGAALTLITSAVLLSFTLNGDGGAGAGLPDRSAQRSAFSPAETSGEQIGPWLTRSTALPATSLIVSAEPAPNGFAVIMQSGENGSDAASAMQIALLDETGSPSAEIRPVLPQSWLLTHAIPERRGDVIVLGQTADGLFLFRIDRQGQPVWGRFEGSDNELAANGASVLKSGELLVISAPSPRGLGLALVAYDLDGRRLWNQFVPGLVAGQYALTGTPSGELVLAGTLASDDGEPGHRIIRFDRSGEVQVDLPLGLMPGNVVRRLAAANDESVYLLSTGQSAVLKRVSPRGNEQWATALPALPSDSVAAPDLVALPDGAIVTSLNAAGLHANRVSGSGLDVAASLAPLPDGLVSLGAQVTGRRQTMSMLLAEQEPASPRLLHASADLRDLFRSPGAGAEAGEAPVRTVSLDDVADAPSIEEAPIMRPIADPAPLVREPAREIEQPRTVSAAADDTEQPLRETSVAAEPSPRLADCRFVCIPAGVPAAKYPVSRSYEITDGRTLNDITLDAFAEHDPLCVESGGLAHAGSVPICEAQ